MPKKPHLAGVRGYERRYSLLRRLALPAFNSKSTVTTCCWRQSAPPPDRCPGSPITAQSRDRRDCCDPARWLVGRGLAVVLRRAGCNRRVRRRTATREGRGSGIRVLPYRVAESESGPSAPGRCGWCGRSESQDAVVLPYGTEPGTHVWLHAHCWTEWRKMRRSQAQDALNRIGIGDLSDGCIVPGGRSHPSNKHQEQ